MLDIRLLLLRFFSLPPPFLTFLTLPQLFRKCGMAPISNSFCATNNQTIGVVKGGPAYNASLAFVIFFPIFSLICLLIFLYYRPHSIFLRKRPVSLFWIQSSVSFKIFCLLRNQRKPFYLALVDPGMQPSSRAL